MTEVQSGSSPAGFAQVEDHVDHLVVCRLFSFFNVFRQSAYTIVTVMFRGRVRGWTYMLNFFLKIMILAKSLKFKMSHLIFL